MGCGSSAPSSNGGKTNAPFNAVCISRERCHKGPPPPQCAALNTPQGIGALPWCDEGGTIDNGQVNVTSLASDNNRNIASGDSLPKLCLIATPIGPEPSNFSAPPTTTNDNDDNSNAAALDSPPLSSGGALSPLLDISSPPFNLPSAVPMDASSEGELRSLFHIVAEDQLDTLSQGGMLFGSTEGSQYKGGSQQVFPNASSPATITTNRSLHSAWPHDHSAAPDSFSNVNPLFAAPNLSLCSFCTQR